MTATLNIAIVTLDSLPSLEVQRACAVWTQGCERRTGYARTRRSRPWLWLNVVGQLDLVLREHRPLYSFNP